MVRTYLLCLVQVDCRFDLTIKIETVIVHYCYKWRNNIVVGRSNNSHDKKLILKSIFFKRVVGHFSNFQIIYYIMLLTSFMRL